MPRGLRMERVMPIHYSNPKCDVCGSRHAVENDKECLQCVLAQTGEDLELLQKENARLRKELAASRNGESDG